MFYLLSETVDSTMRSPTAGRSALHREPTLWRSSSSIGALCETIGGRNDPQEPLYLLLEVNTGGGARRDSVGFFIPHCRDKRSHTLPVYAAAASAPAQRYRKRRSCWE